MKDHNYQEPRRVQNNYGERDAFKSGNTAGICSDAGQGVKPSKFAQEKKSWAFNPRNAQKSEVRFTPSGSPQPLRAVFNQSTGCWERAGAAKAAPAPVSHAALLKQAERAIAIADAKSAADKAESVAAKEFARLNQLRGPDAPELGMPARTFPGCGEEEPVPAQAPAAPAPVPSVGPVQPELF